MIFNSPEQRVLYENKKDFFLNKLSIISPADRIFIAYHGDCDGISSAVFTIQYLNERNIKEVSYLSCAQFRESEFLDIQKASINSDYIIFLEGYGFSDEYSELSKKSFNIDHHPVSPRIEIFFNPREFSINPNPANALATYTNSLAKLRK